MQMGSLGFPELLVILFVVLLLFGPKRLPEVSRGLGKAVRDFKRGLEQGLDEVAEPAKKAVASARAAGEEGGAAGAGPDAAAPSTSAPEAPAAPAKGAPATTAPAAAAEQANGPDAADAHGTGPHEGEPPARAA